MTPRGWYVAAWWTVEVAWLVALTLLLNHTVCALWSLWTTPALPWWPMCWVCAIAVLVFYVLVKNERGGPWP